MKPKRFRPIVKKMPEKYVKILEGRHKILSQEKLIDLMVKRDKAASLGNKYKDLVADLDKRISMLDK